MPQPVAVDRRIGYTTKRLQQALRAAADRALRPHGLTMPQYAALAVLAQWPGLSNSELARRTFVTRQTMNELLTGLHAAGLITRAAHPEHARVRRTELTAAGRDAVQHGDSAVTTVEQRMTSGLTDRQEQQLLDLMLACTANLETEPP